MPSSDHPHESAAERPLVEQLQLALRKLAAVEDDLRRQNAALENALQAATEENQHYRTLFENANDAIAFIALDGTVTSTNRGAARLLNLPREQIIGRPYASFLTPASLELTAERFRLSLAGESIPSTFTLELIRPDGGVVPVEARTRFLRDQNGALTGILGIYRDVTERKRVEDELRRAHAELELRVRERTEELRRANDALTAEVAERKRAEEAARAAEREYRSIFENASEGIYRSSLDGHQLRANPALVKLNGYSSEEEMLPSVNDIAAEWYVDPHRRDEFKGLLDEYGQIANFESEVYRHKTRERIWISENARLVRGADGTPLYYEGTVQDILPRKRAEEALRASEEQYRLLFDRNPHPMWVCDAETSAFLAVNDVAVQHYGYTHEEFLSMTTRDLRPPEEGTAAEGRAARGGAGGLSVGTWRHRRKDGTVIDVEVTSHDLLFRGRPTRIVSVNDITARRRAEESLRVLNETLEHRVAERTAELERANDALRAEVVDRRRAEATLERLRQQNELILNSAGEGIYGLDVEGRATFVNPTAARILGYEVRELLGQFLHKVMHHSRPDGTPYPVEECPILTTIRDGLAMHVTDDVYWRRDGVSFPVEYISSPIRNERQEVIGAVVSFQDITQRKEVDRMKDELISTVSHELRTPLTSLRGFTELMLGRDYPAEKQREFLGIIHRESARLTNLINDFLDIQRIEAGNQPYAFAAAEVEALVRGALQVFTKLEGSHPVRTAVPAGLPRVRADVERMHQVLCNLLSNAIKFSPRGGEVVVGARPGADEVTFWVADRGVGIPADALPRLFKKFFRVDNSVTRGIGGTGLGLALVKEIVLAHQGRVWVESALGEGSVFYFTLPCAGV